MAWTSNNPHRVETKWSEIAYYGPSKSGNGYIVPCGVNDSPTRATLRGIGAGAYPEFDFELPRQMHEMAKVNLLMQRAYERGRLDNKADLGRLLKDLVAI